jgi:phosphatidylglycerophosphatase A
MSLARLIASGFGTGYAPVASGTVASVAALAIGAAMSAVSPLLLAVAASLAVGGGIWAIFAARVEGDPGWVVVDEFAGQWIALIGLAQITPLGLLAAFALFRLLDIAKPGPIGWADRRSGPFGIMGDDVIAGIATAVVLHLMRDWL